MSKNYKWAVVGMLWFVCFFNYADRQAISAVLKPVGEEFQFDSVQLGLIGSIFAWVYAAGAPFAGFIADRFSRKYLILGGCVFWSGITMMTGWCSRFWQFLLVRGLEGLGETFYFPATMSLVSDYHDRRTRSRAFSLHQSSVYVGSIGGSWAGAWFAQHMGWRVGFYFFGAAGGLVALGLWRFLREPRRGAADHAAGVVSAPMETPLGAKETIAEIFRRPTAVLLILAFLAANFVATIFMIWTPKFFADKFALSLTDAAFAATVFVNVASALSVPFGGWLADRLARRFAGGRIMVQAFALMIGATFIGLIGMVSNLHVVIVAMSVFGLCKGLYDSNIFASLYDVIAPRARASAAGIMNTVGWGGGALGPFAVGLATKYGRHLPLDGSAAAKRAAEVANMSEAIAFGAVIYVVGGTLLLIAAFGHAKRDVLRTPVAV